MVHNRLETFHPENRVAGRRLSRSANDKLTLLSNHAGRLIKPNDPDSSKKGKNIPAKASCFFRIHGPATL
jgi:hypothetical protein